MCVYERVRARVRAHAHTISFRLLLDMVNWEMYPKERRGGGGGETMPNATVTTGMILPENGSDVNHVNVLSTGRWGWDRVTRECL